MGQAVLDNDSSDAQMYTGIENTSLWREAVSSRERPSVVRPSSFRETCFLETVKQINAKCPPNHA